MSDLAPLTERAIVVCCGSGGVGKTTTAAALAVEGARRGRRACVVTIDPSKRLAAALGLSELTNAASLVKGDWPGELWALMLDTKTTFDNLVIQHAASPEQADGILRNGLYRNISGALSGTQEYMAMEKLHELYEEGQFELIVVDTPPTRNALDFLDAPRRLTRFLDNRVFRLLVTPTRAYLKAVSLATQAFLRTVSRVVGSEVVSDAMAFFRAFEGMEEGFRLRAQRVQTLLAGETAAFVLVSTPRRDAVTEAEFFARRLTESGIGVDALVVNRIHPRFSGVEVSADPGALRARAASLAGTPLGALYENLADFRQVSLSEESHIGQLAGQVAPAPVVRVPMLAGDIHDLDGLALVGGYLFATGAAQSGG